MLSFNAKCRYGLTALLALAAHYDGGLLRIRDLAEANAIPRQYLEQIFNVLGKAGIVTSVRGKKGGYRLARSPEAISVLEVINALEGGIVLVAEAEEQPDAVAELFQRCQDALTKILDISLADLLLRQQSLNNTFAFEI